jgi:cell division septal protein FtsQ
MSIGVKTNKPWQKHASYTPHKVHGSYYDEQIKKRRGKIARIIYFIFFILLIQSIFQAPFLSLSKIELSGNSLYQEEDVKIYVRSELGNKKWLFFENNNFFLFDSNKLKNALISQYNLSNAEVSKKFPNKIKLNFTEKTSQFVWKKNNTYNLLDAKGQFNGLIDQPNDKYIILDDSRSYQPQNNENIFRVDELELIQGIIVMWNDKLASKVKIKAIYIGDNWSNFDIGTNLSYLVKINPQENASVQLDYLYRILESGNVQGTDINYIDLRFGEKAFIK